MGTPIKVGVVGSGDTQQDMYLDSDVLRQMATGGGGGSAQLAPAANGQYPVQVGQVTVWAQSPQDAMMIAQRLGGGGGNSGSGLLRTIADAGNAASALMSRLNLDDLRNQMFTAERAADAALALYEKEASADPNLVAYLKADRAAMLANDQAIADAATRALVQAVTGGAQTVADVVDGYQQVYGPMGFGGGGGGGGMGNLGAGLIGAGAGFGLGALLFDRPRYNQYGQNPNAPGYQGNLR